MNSVIRNRIHMTTRCTTKRNGLDLCWNLLFCRRNIFW